MSEMTIKGLKEGTTVAMPLLLSSVVKGVTNAGAPYLSMVFQDKTGSIDGKLWDASEEQQQIKAGSIYFVSGEVIQYRTALQLRVHNLTIVDSDQVELSDFVTSTEIPTEELKERVYHTINSMQNEVLKEISMTLIQENETDFFEYPAASKNHHDFVGGLATHVVGMLQIGESLCTIYPEINRDLLLSGIIVHDLGKLEELSGAVLTEYTLEGKLLGHISIMQSRVNEAAIKLGYEGSEEVTLLRHMILSHHGQYEYGSPVLPMVAEAEYLAFIDNLDARVNMLSKALAQIEPGNFTPRIFSLENRSFYKPKF